METKKVQEDLSTLQTFKASLERDMNNLDVATSTGENEKIFLAMKRAGLQDLETQLDTIDKHQYFMKIEYTRHSQLDMLSKLPSFGRFSTKKIQRQPSILPASLRDRALVKVAERDVQQRDDGKTCSITGSVFLPSGESLICDFANSKVKLLDTEITVQADVRLTSGPRDVAMVTEREVVVSLPGEKRLQYVMVSGLKPGRKVRIDKLCYGLAVHMGLIFVTCHDVGEILMMTKDGDILRRISMTDAITRRFIIPNYISVDAFGEKIYVFDWLRHSVTCQTLAKRQVFHCEMEGERHSHSLLVDSEGGVLVCSKDASTTSLQFLTPDGKHYRTLMTWPTERWTPLTFCYRSCDRTMSVGMCDNNKILVYRFE